MNRGATSVADYLSKVDKSELDALKKLRALVKKSVPKVNESLQFGMPTYEYRGLLCAIAAQKHHISFYIMDTSIVSKYKKELGKLSIGKSCIRFKKIEEVSLTLFGKMLKEAAANNKKR